MRSELQELTARLDGLDGLAQAQSEIEARVASLQNVLAIDAVSRFTGYVQLESEPLVSVVLPTYCRPERLRRAIGSVLAQRYARWELLVVDDGGDVDSKSVVEATGDQRVRWMRIDHRGVCAARNAALARASGQIVAYLDDDNLMDPGWLSAVAWAFNKHPEVDVLYGAFVVDDVLRVNGKSSGQLPRTFLYPWDRNALRNGNLADMGAIAHRSGLPEATFDESLREMGDWDLLIRLTADRDPLVLPAVACYYTTDAPERLSGGPTQRADWAEVTRRARGVEC